MYIFFILLALLILSIGFFFGFPLIKRRILPEKFNSFCDKKIRKICKKNKYLVLQDLCVSNYDSKKIKFENVVFGKKFIYLVYSNCLMGDVTGDRKDNSWIYKKYGQKNTEYVDNLNNKLFENMQDFIGIINVKREFIVGIYVVPNECDFQIKDANRANSFVIHYSSLGSLISKIESRNIEDLNGETIIQNFELLKGKNEQEKRANINN